MALLLVAPPTRRLRNPRRRLWLALAVVLVVAAALLGPRLTYDMRLARWEAGCVTAGGAVVPQSPAASNQLVVGSADLAYRCRAVHGETLDTWG